MQTSSFKCSLLLAGVSVWVGVLAPFARAEPPTTVESQTVGTAGKAVLVFSDSEKSQTLEAEGRDVSIDGNKNEITLHGKCHALTITGDGNIVHAEAVATISTPGNKNIVTWMSVVDGDKPQITNVGSGNSIEHSSK